MPRRDTRKKKERDCKKIERERDIYQEGIEGKKRERERERQTETDRDRQRQTETDRDRQRQKIEREIYI